MSGNEEKIESETYSAPHLSDYGPISELTKTVTGNVGCDGGLTPSSYTAS